MLFFTQKQIIQQTEQKTSQFFTFHIVHNTFFSLFLLLKFQFMKIVNTIPNLLLFLQYCYYEYNQTLLFRIFDKDFNRFKNIYKIFVNICIHKSTDST